MVAAFSLQPHRQQWNALGCSVIGASHLRSGSINQDAVDFWPRSADSPMAVLAVADGHGGNRYFRSHLGAQLAVKIAVQLGRSFPSELGGEISFNLVRSTAEEKLPRDIVVAWKREIDQHLQASPFREEELRLVGQLEGEKAVRAVESDPYLAYGTTLLLAVASQDYVLYLQLGDGDILLVNQDGEVSCPLPRDERLIGNETTSLCGPRAWQDFRFAVHDVPRQAPALIILSTDGYSNSFVSMDDYMQVGPDIYRFALENGLVGLKAELGNWLAETSARGSGDDVTVGILCSLSSIDNMEWSAQKPLIKEPADDE